MNEGLRRALGRARVGTFHPSQEAASGAPQTAGTPGPARRRLTPSELHEQRVEWGRVWGARISQATKEWKGEL